MVNGIPVARPARSVIDAAAELNADELDTVIDAVIRQRLVTIDELVAMVDRVGSQGRKGLGRLRKLLQERDPSTRVPDSRFNRLVGQLLVAAGLPDPEYEFEVRSGARLVGRADLAYPEAQLLIELDSARWHHNRAAFLADPRRKNELMLAGYQVLSFTWDDYASRADQVAAIVGAALSKRFEQKSTA